MPVIAWVMVLIPMLHSFSTMVLLCSDDIVTHRFCKTKSRQSRPNLPKRNMISAIGLMQIKKCMNSHLDKYRTSCTFFNTLEQSRLGYYFRATNESYVT